MVHLATHLERDPNSTERGSLTAKVTTDAGHEQELSLTDGPAEITVPVGAGLNRIVCRSSGSGSLRLGFSAISLIFSDDYPHISPQR
jgi:hypothetical protein